MTAEATELDEDRVALRVRGKEFSGWTSIQIDESIEDAATTFSVGLAGVYATSAGFVQEDDDVEVWVGTERVCAGVVDDLELGGDADNETVQIVGRSKTRALGDCSAPLGSWSGQRLLKLLSILLDGYEIEVVDEAGVGAEIVRSHRTEEGESIFDALDRLSRDLAFMVTDDGQGRLVLTRAGAAGRATDTIIRGTPGFISGNVSRSCRERFSEYQIRGQVIGDNDVDPNVQGGADDAGVKRFRRLIVKPEKGLSPAGALARAKWEATTRAAKALKATYVVRGWRQADGSRWRKNLIVEVTDGYGGLYGVDLLIVSVHPSLDPEAGRLTTMQLAPALAYTPAPLPTVSTAAYVYEPAESTDPDFDQPEAE